MSKYSFNGKIDWKWDPFTRIDDHINKHILGEYNPYYEMEYEKWSEVFKSKDLDITELTKNYTSFSIKEKENSRLFMEYVAKANEIVDDYKYFYLYDDSYNKRSINFVDVNNFNTCIQLDKKGHSVISTCFYRTHLNEDSVIVSFAYNKAIGNAKRINTNNKYIIDSLFKKPMDVVIKSHNKTIYSYTLSNYTDNDIIFTKQEQDVLSYIYYFASSKAIDMKDENHALYYNLSNGMNALFDKNIDKNLNARFDGDISYLRDNIIKHSKEHNEDELSYEIDEYILSLLMMLFVNKEYIPVSNDIKVNQEYFYFYKNLLEKINRVLR